MKFNIFERSWTNFSQAEFVMNYFDKDWSNILNLKRGSINESVEEFVNNLNDLIDKHILFKKISYCKLKFKTKPWILHFFKNQFLFKMCHFKNASS